MKFKTTHTTRLLLFKHLFNVVLATKDKNDNAAKIPHGNDLLNSESTISTPFNLNVTYDMSELSNSKNAILKYLKTPHINEIRSVVTIKHLTALEYFNFDNVDSLDCNYYFEEGSKYFTSVFNDIRKSDVVFDYIESPFPSDIHFNTLFLDFIQPFQQVLQDMQNFEEHIDKITSVPEVNTEKKHALSTCFNHKTGLNDCAVTIESQIPETPIYGTYKPINYNAYDTGKKENGITEYQLRHKKQQLAIHNIGVLMSALIHVCAFEKNINSMLDIRFFVNLLMSPDFILPKKNNLAVIEFIKTVKTEFGLKGSAEKQANLIQFLQKNEDYVGAKKYFNEIIDVTKKQIDESIWVIAKNDFVFSSGIHSFPQTLLQQIDRFFKDFTNVSKGLSALANFIEYDILPNNFSDPSEITRKKVYMICYSLCKIKYFTAIFSNSCDLYDCYDLYEELCVFIKELFDIYNDSKAILKSKGSKETINKAQSKIDYETKNLSNKLGMIRNNYFFYTATSKSILTEKNRGNILSYFKQLSNRNNKLFLRLVKYSLTQSKKTPEFSKFVIDFFNVNFESENKKYFAK